MGEIRGKIIADNFNVSYVEGSQNPQSEHRRGLSMSTHRFLASFYKPRRTSGEARSSPGGRDLDCQLLCISLRESEGLVTNIALGGKIFRFLSDARASASSCEIACN